MMTYTDDCIAAAIREITAPFDDPERVAMIAFEIVGDLSDCAALKDAEKPVIDFMARQAVEGS